VFWQSYFQSAPLLLSRVSQPGGTFDSTWTGWPRALVDETDGTLQIVYAAGGRDMQAEYPHDYATTGLRTWALDKLTNWSAF